MMLRLLLTSKQSEAALLPMRAARRYAGPYVNLQLLLVIATICFKCHDEPENQQYALQRQEHGCADVRTGLLVAAGSKHSEQAKR